MQLQCLATNVEKGQRKEHMVTRACNLNTWAAKARECLQVRGQPKLHCEFYMSKKNSHKEKVMDKNSGKQGCIWHDSLGRFVEFIM